MMMSRLATVDCRATRSNFLLWSENALGENIKENKGDRGIGRENTHCPVLTISREIENDYHSQSQERSRVIERVLSHNAFYVRRYLPVYLRMRMRIVRN